MLLPINEFNAALCAVGIVYPVTVLPDQVLSTTKKHMTQDRRRIELSSTFGGSKAPLAQQKGVDGRR